MDLTEQALFLNSQKEAGLEPCTIRPDLTDKFGMLGEFVGFKRVGTPAQFAKPCKPYNLNP